MLFMCLDKVYFFKTPNKMSVFLQKLRNFHSLSCPGITSGDLSGSGQGEPTLRCNTNDLSENEDSSEDVQSWPKDCELTRNELAAEEADRNFTNCCSSMAEMTNGKDGEPLWAGLCSMRRDVYQLGGELDIEQIERN